jgi:RNA polymerase sigma-70 factor (ECF subfamily)
MLGSFAEAEDLVHDTLERAWKARAEYRGTASVERWLYAIATNACINALAQRRRRELPQLELGPARDESALVETEVERWLSPAADAALFPDASDVLEQRETVTLAFVALLQRVPPRQRAALVLKDVLGWSAEDIAATLALSLPSVNSALHRARVAISIEKAAADEPPEEAVRSFVRAWETRDLDALVKLLRDDVTLAMPPYSAWFLGVESVIQFFRSERFQAFWTSLARVEATRANNRPAFAFLRSVEGAKIPHSIMVTDFRGTEVSGMTVFIGGSNFTGFGLSDAVSAQFRGPRLS